MAGPKHGVELGGHVLQRRKLISRSRWTDDHILQIKLYLFFKLTNRFQMAEGFWGFGVLGFWGFGINLGIEIRDWDLDWALGFRIGIGDWIWELLIMIG